MKALYLLPLLLLSTPAFASHPHDRVCVAKAQVGEELVDEFVFQWELERLYDHGGPNEDTHQITAQASASYGDYQDSPSEKMSIEAQKIPPGSRKPVDVKLKSAKGKIYVDAKFDFTKEKLSGKINRNFFEADAKDQLVEATFTLHCISQPRLTLDPVQD
jgi:hypothetical protein